MTINNELIEKLLNEDVSDSLEDVTKQNVELKSLIAPMRDEISALEENKETLLTKVGESDDKVVELTEALETVKAEVDVLKSEHDAKITTLEADKTALDAQLAESKKLFTNIETEYQDMLIELVVKNRELISELDEDAKSNLIKQLKNDSIEKLKIRLEEQALFNGKVSMSLKDNGTSEEFVPSPPVGSKVEDSTIEGKEENSTDDVRIWDIDV